MAVLRLTVNPTENLTKARFYQGIKISHFLWLTYFTTNSQIFVRFTDKPLGGIQSILKFLMTEIRYIKYIKEMERKKEKRKEKRFEL